MQINIKKETPQHCFVRGWVKPADCSPIWRVKNNRSSQEMEFPASLEGYLNLKPIDKVQSIAVVAKSASYPA